MIRKLLAILTDVDGVPTDFESLPVLRDVDHTFAVKETISGTIIMPPYDGTNGALTQFTHAGTGQYHLTIDRPPAGKSYTYCVEIIRNGQKRYKLETFADDLDEEAGGGNTLVNQDTGGTDNLRVMSNGQPVDGAKLRAYLTSDYAAGATTARVRGNATTNVQGRWVNPMYLDAGFNYTFVADKPGAMNATATTVNV